MMPKSGTYVKSNRPRVDLKAGIQRRGATSGPTILDFFLQKIGCRDTIHGHILSLILKCEDVFNYPWRTRSIRVLIHSEPRRLNLALPTRRLIQAGGGISQV